MSKINQIERASRAWPVLIKAARKERGFLTYKELGDNLGIHHRVVRFVLGVIQSYCLFEDLPPLTILVVGATGLPGTGFIAHDIEKFGSGVDLVRKFDWASHGNPFIFEGGELDEATIIRLLKNDPDNSSEIYAKIKSRGMKQILFKKALLNIYKNKCAFTGLEFVDGLEACHIKPWSVSSPEEKMDVRNGILLNRFHHKLFDDHYFTVSASHEILFWDPTGKYRKYSSLEKQLTLNLHGNSMNLPFKRNQKPAQKYLDYHSKEFEYYK